MSSGTAPSAPACGESPPGELRDARIEAIIDQRLLQARRQVKGVDIAGGLLTLAIATLTYLLLAALIDHWVVTGGLGFLGRLLLFLGLLGGVGWYFARRIFPPLVHRINPIFAAHTIEQSRPTLKNSLINFLLFRRSHGREVPRVVYQAMQHRAAADLSQIEIEVAVDRSHVIRLGYVLAGVLAVCCLYLVLSTKSPLTSAARVLWPWASTKAPTRVTIEDIVVEVAGQNVEIVDDGKPQMVVAFHEEFVSVSAVVRGLDDGEEVLLRYSTVDRQSVDQAVPMTPDDSGQYRGRLPPGDRGLQQDLQCYLAAGDFRTRPFTIEVQTAPAISVERIDYDYPDYTGLSDRSVADQGDIREIEGTVVTIRAIANREIRHAEIDFDYDGTSRREMEPRNDRAVGRFTLRMHADDPSRPQHDCYRLLFTDHQRRSNPRPTRHRIEVVPDRPPEIQLLHPQQDVEVPEDGRLEIRLRAEDPDFALRRVILKVKCDGKDLDIPSLLDKPHPGEFQTVYPFEPARLGLKAGDRVLCWAEAEDNKQPQPGYAGTGERRITIVGRESRVPPQEPSEPQPQEPERNPQQPQPAERPGQAEKPEDQPPQEPDQPQQPDQRQEQGPEGQEQQPGAPDQQQPPQPGEGVQSPDGPGKSESDNTGENQGQNSDSPPDQSNDPIDSETQEGDAIERILEHREQQQQDDQQQESQGQDDQQQNGQGQSDQQQNGQGQDDQQQKGKGQNDQRQNGQGQDDQQQKGQGQSDQQQNGQGQDDQRQNGQGQDDQQQKGQGQSDQQQNGQGQDDQQQKGQGQSDQQQNGQGQDDQQQKGQGQDDQKQSEQKPGTSGEKKPQSSPGAGERSADGSGSPKPQQGNHQRPKEPGQSGQKQPDGGKQPAESPSTSPKQSDSQSDTEGDRSGGGKKGGGQQAKQPGRGSPGSQTEAEDGAGQSKQQGPGETGPRGGDQVETDQQTGQSTKREGGQGSDPRRKQPSDQGAGKSPKQQDDSSSHGTPMENPPDGGTPGSQQSKGPGAHGDGPPTTGGGPDQRRNPQAASDSSSLSDDPNLEYANKATDLALEHLNDQMDRADSDLLERLGWSREEAAEFIERWQQMKQAAGRQGAQGQEAKRSLDEALKSLGLRRRGTQLHSDRTPSDGHRGMRESGRFTAPADWKEWMDAYNRGVAGGRR